MATGTTSWPDFIRGAVDERQKELKLINQQVS
jgi:hypothetical protein